MVLSLIEKLRKLSLFGLQYAKYKKWCDDYFYIPARKEHRGVGKSNACKRINLENCIKYSLHVMAMV
jgi:coproporphyrinogen III oxidase